MSYSSFAIGGMLGCAIFGLIIERYKMDVMLLSNVCRGLTGAIAASLCFCKDNASFTTMTGILGFICGQYHTTLPLLLISQFGLKSLSSTYGIVSMFAGVAGLLSSPLVGFLMEVTGQGNTPFLGAMIAFLTSSLLGFVQEWYKLK